MQDRRFSVMDITALVILAFVCVAILGFTSPTKANAQNSWAQDTWENCISLACPNAMTVQPQYVQPPPVAPPVNIQDYLDPVYTPPPSGPPRVIRQSPGFNNGLSQSDFWYPTTEQQLQADAIAADAANAASLERAIREGQYP